MEKEIDFLDDAVQFTASEDLATINPNSFKISASRAYGIIADRSTKSVAQNIETSERKKEELRTKMDIANGKIEDKKTVIQSKIDGYLLDIEKINADIAEAKTGKTLDPLYTKKAKIEGYIDKQQKDFDVLSAKETANDNDFADKIDEINAYIEDQKINGAKLDFDLSAGAITVCEEWLTKRLYPQLIGFGSKETEKGQLVEEESMDFLNAHVYRDYMSFKKNPQTEPSEDDYFRGIRDGVLHNFSAPDDDITVDIKNMFTQKTMGKALFSKTIPDIAYYWQGLVYCELYNNQRFEITYVLVDMPDKLIMQMAKNELGWLFQQNPTFEADYENFAKQFKYKDVPAYLKQKRFAFKKNDADIEKLKHKVRECRRYIAYLIEQIIEHEKNNCL
jgi:hypothetical protein